MSVTFWFSTCMGVVIAISCILALVGSLKLCNKYRVWSDYLKLLCLGIVIAGFYFLRCVPLDLLVENHTFNKSVNTIMNMSEFIGVSHLSSVNEVLSSNYADKSIAEYKYDTVTVDWAEKKISLLDYLRYCKNANLDSVVTLNISLNKRTEMFHYSGVVNKLVQDSSAYYVMDKYKFKMIQPTVTKSGTIDRDPFKNITLGANLDVDIVYDSSTLKTNGVIENYSVVNLNQLS